MIHFLGQAPRGGWMHQSRAVGARINGHARKHPKVLFSLHLGLSVVLP
jgi:hypothetical protein